jgi:arsenite-transporting ATPase
VPRLSAADVDAAAAFTAWLAPRRDRLRTIAGRGTSLDDSDVARLLDLSMPGIDELGGLLAIAQHAAAYEAIVIDTAPTGHTLRLLGMPSLYGGLARLLDGLQDHHRQVVRALLGRYQPDAADALIAEIEEDAGRLARVLRDPRHTAFVWMTLAEPMALEETADALAALAAAGLPAPAVVVNRLAPAGGCEWDEARRRFESRTIAPLIRRYPGVSFQAVPEMPDEPRGVPALRQVAAACRPLRRMRARPPVATRVYGAGGAGEPVDPAVTLDAPGTRWLLFGGKGGAGKTTTAAAVALRLAAAVPERRVLLLSSDPAHSLADVFGVPIGDRAVRVPHAPANLDVREVDATAGFHEFRDRYLAAAAETFSRLPGAGGDDSGDAAAFRRLLDLAPPGVDEAIAIAEIADLLEHPDVLVVSDTAPTGHALRLLAMPDLMREWARALMALLLKYQPLVNAGALGDLLLQLSRRLGALRARLTDSRQSGFVPVTRAAVLPIEETRRLIERLNATGIAVRGIVVNALGAGTCARCRAAGARERAALQPLLRKSRPPGAYAIIGAPAALPPPHGAAALGAWSRRWRRIN